MGKDKDGADNSGPLITLKPWVRRSAAGVGVGIAGAHLLWPALAIDGVFLGALAFAAFISLFDVDSIEWQGIKATRRIARAKAALDDAPPAAVVALPEAPPAPPQKQSSQVLEAFEKYRQQAYLAAWNAVRETPASFISANKFFLFARTAEDVRIELVLLAGNTGRLQRVAAWSDYGVDELIEYLRPANLLSPQLINAILTLYRMRNELRHSRTAEAAAELAADAVQNLRAIPRAYFRVRDPNVKVFRDQALTVPHDSPAVMLAQINQDASVQPENVYPRKIEYTKGRFVSWEWDTSRGTDDPAWYKDAAGEAKMGWGSAATFAGREYPEEWALEKRLPNSDLGLE
jgi:hypothetical protein